MKNSIHDTLVPTLLNTCTLNTTAFLHLFPPKAHLGTADVQVCAEISAESPAGAPVCSSASMGKVAKWLSDGNCR